jgi:hypothetical protein
MATPLFYKRVIPLDSRTHRELRVKQSDKPLAFASGSSVIPALVEEFAAAASEIPVAFMPGADAPSAVFITGLKPGHNVFVTDSGRWSGTYVPAYLRRYPFIIGDVPNGEPILCIDDSYDGFSTKTGTRLFTSDAAPDESLQQALSFAQGYKVAAEKTDAACAKLKKLGLFRSVTLDAKLADGQTTVVHGLLIIDEEALAALPSETIAELHAEQLLKPIYAHLVSLGALSRLGEREQAAEAKPAAA